MAIKWLRGAMVITLLLPAAFAQAKNFSTSAGILLSKQSNVRAEGMGGAQTAVLTDEAGAMGWNPAGLFGIQDQALSLAYANGLVDDNFGAANYALPIGTNLAAGAHFSYYDAGKFELNDDETNSTSIVFAEKDFVLGATAAYHLDFQPDCTVGANLKAIRSSLLNSYTATAVAADLGAISELKGVVDHLRVGLAIRNLGTPMKYLEAAEPLPSYALAGVSYLWMVNEIFSVLAAADGQYDLEKSWRENLGVDIKIMQMFSVRAGYKAGYDLAAFTVGVGFGMENFQLDYAFDPSQSLNSLHRVSLSYAFGTAPLPAAQPAAEAPDESENAEMQKKVEPVYQGPTQPVTAEILEIQRVGGRAAKVIMNIGSEQKVKVGYEGTVFDASGTPIATLLVRQVDPKISLADVVGLGRDIGNDVKVEIKIPIAK